jgi:hypothetical protein
MGNYSRRFLDGDGTDGSVQLAGSPYDITAHPGEKWQLQSADNGIAWNLKNLGTNGDAYLCGDNYSGAVYLDTLESSSGNTHWTINAIPGKNGQYAIRRMGALLVYLSGDTQTGSVQLAETWDPNDPALSWVVFDAT